MKSFTGYIVCKAECHLCSHKWTGVVEVDCIEIDGITEYKKPKELECSNCGAMTDNYMVVEETKTPPFTSKFELGDKVNVNLFESGSFTGYILRISFGVGKVYYDVRVFPFESEEQNKHLYQDFLTVDSYFVSK